MKYLCLIIAAVYFTVPSLVSAQSKDLHGTKGLPDGEFWMKLDSADKVQFIHAVEFGIKTYWKDAAALAAKDSVTRTRFIPPNPRDTATFPAGSVIKQMDAVYRDTANTGIPIVFVYRYAVGELSGESQAKLDHMLEVWEKKR